MQEKKLLAGIKTVTASGAGVCAFILIMTGSLKDSVTVAAVGMCSFILISVVVSLLGKWFKKAEIAVLTLALCGLVAGLLSNFSDRSGHGVYLILMVISFGYVISIGTGNYNERLSVEWGFGAGIGFGIMAITIGILRCFLPCQPGFAFFVSAAVVATAKKLFILKKDE